MAWLRAWGERNKRFVAHVPHGPLEDHDLHCCPSP